MEQANANSSAVNKQRIFRPEEEILKHLAEQETSGFSVKDYCEMYDINETTFNSWIKRFRKGEEEKGFATIEIIPSVAKPGLFAEVGAIKIYQEVPAEYLKALLS
jgi:hypothetical protein